MEATQGIHRPGNRAVKWFIIQESAGLTEPVHAFQEL